MLPTVVRAFWEEGYLMRLGSPRLLTSGVQPIDGRRYLRNYGAVSTTDQGFTIRDFYVFQLIGAELAPRTGLIIGNAYGISTVCVAEALRPISVDVIDAEVSPAITRPGTELTRRVVDRLGLDVRISTGFSPRDLDDACRHDRYDLVFVDGEHTDAQMIADFRGVRDRLADRAAVVFHDVGQLHMDRGWEEIRRAAEPLGFTGHDLTFTDFGTTVLLRGLPELASMLEVTCPGLRELNEQYHLGFGNMHLDARPEKRVVYLAPGARIAFYGAGRDFNAHARFIERHPGVVAAVADDDPALWSSRRIGIPVVDPRTLPDLGVSAIIISTCRFDLEVRARLAALMPETPVHGAGRADDPIELHVTSADLGRRQAAEQPVGLRDSCLTAGA
jgi:hypothetical protein